MQWDGRRQDHPRPSQTLCSDDVWNSSADMIQLACTRMQTGIMQGPGIWPTFHVAELQRFADKPQAGESSVSMDQQAHDAGTFRVSGPHLLSPHHAQHHRADSLQVTGIGCNADPDGLLGRLRGLSWHLLG